MNWKRWIIVSAAALALACLVYALFQLIVVAVVSAIVASGVAIAVYRHLERRSRPAPEAKRDPRARLIAMLNGLVGLNIRIREEALPVSVIARVEAIIDKLRALLEEVNERYPEHELTWTINQMAKEYLGRIVNPYLALAGPDREASGAELQRSLDGLESEIDNVADLIRRDKMGDFKAKAAFLRARFVQGA